MIIAPHHIKGTVENRISTKLCTAVEYTPVCAWPDDCMVQWGNGLIPRNPFFEAFPKGTFIRGDGATIEEAERKAFAQYLSEFECDHVWGRKRPGGDTYTNGAGWCRKCKAFRSRMFCEVITLGHMRKPLAHWEYEYLIECEEDEDGMEAHMAAKYPNDVASRAKYLRKLRLRENLFGHETQEEFSARMKRLYYEPSHCRRTLNIDFTQMRT